MPVDSMTISEKYRHGKTLLSDIYYYRTHTKYDANVMFSSCLSFLLFTGRALQPKSANAHGPARSQRAPKGSVPKQQAKRLVVYISVLLGSKYKMVPDRHVI